MDFNTLVLRDHDLLDRTLLALTDPRTAPEQLDTAIEGFHFQLSVHVIAETRVLAAVLDTTPTPSPVLCSIVQQLRSEHSEQQRDAARLMRIDRGSTAWYDGALQLRIKLLEHATREIYADSALDDHLQVSERRSLASRFVTERLELLATMSPHELARALRAA